MARTLDPSTGYGDIDTESDSEQETPKKPRQHLKKRLSEVHNHSFSPDRGRAPLKPVNLNDDAAEKRRRRKSTKLAVLESSHVGSSTEGHGAEQDQSESSGMTKQKHQLTSVAETPVINVPLDVMSSNFEEWMKMATDNKINAANSWSFALIDYFHDMSLLRNNTDNSINFQRASCTLDGCVKIWTSRVDSVGTETGKLLSNLANEGRGNDDEEATSDNPDAQDPSQPKKKKGHRAEATLAKNPTQLRSKKLDLEFSVDPLFKKTCADFDEGGAHGLLMNHLSLGVGSEGGMRVTFDASDSMGKVAEEQELLEAEEMIDLSDIRREFLPDMTALEDRAISHSLANFSFSKDTFSLDTFDDAAFEDDIRRYDDEDNEPFAEGDDNVDMAAVDGAAPPVEDFFQGEQAVADDFPNGPNDYGADFPSNGSAEARAEEVENGGRPGPIQPFDPRRMPNERDLVLAMTDADGEGGMMDYFDQNFLKNWAGPEHWRLRKVVRRPEAAETKVARAPKEKKEAFKIDFLTPTDKDIKEVVKEIFAPVTKGAGINLPGTGPASKSRKSKKVRDKEGREKRDDHRLPDDMHFNSRQLVTLFLKPKFSLRMRGHRVRFNERDGEVDVNFWAQAAADQASGRADDQDDEAADDSAIPFNTQFFHDDYDDGPGFDDEADGEGAMGAADADAGEQDLLAYKEGKIQRVRPQFVNYAKKAKRVDVRKLKDNIWKNLDIVVPEREEMELDDPPTATDPSESRVFSSVISGLRKTYPREKMDEISTSFCFICLLHLANEQGLKLQSAAEDMVKGVPDEECVDQKVGGIWDLMVYRDPNAFTTPDS